MELVYQIKSSLTPIYSESDPNLFPESDPNLFPIYSNLFPNLFPNLFQFIPQFISQFISQFIPQFIWPQFITDFKSHSFRENTTRSIS